MLSVEEPSGASWANAEFPTVRLRDAADSLGLLTEWDAWAAYHGVN